MSNVLQDMLKAFKIVKFEDKISGLKSILTSTAGNSNLENLFSMIQTYLSVCQSYQHLAKTVSDISVSGLLNFNKFLSVIIKVFCEIMTNGFCPIKDLDDGPSKTSNEFKSSEEESGLGQGEGSKDVSDQIENEDMLDGAYQNQEDANDQEEKDNKEEDNGIEMSENFESNLQDKDKDDEDDDENDKDEDNKNELDDEKGEVDNSEEIDKDMWGDEDEDDDSKEDLDEGDKGQSSEEKLEELSAKEDKEKSDDKRQRKEEKSDENPEFDDDQTDPYHGEDKQFPEPEAFDLPENMELDNVENEENFEEPESNDPEVLPDFEEEERDQDNLDEDADKGNPDIDTLEEEEDTSQADNNKDLEASEEKEEDAMEVDQKVENKESDSGMDVDETSDQKATDASNENEQKPEHDQGSDGLNTDTKDSESKDSFGVKTNNEKREEDMESGTGNKSDNEKLLAENTENAEKLDIVEGMAVDESEHGEANIFQHVDSEKETDRTAIDKAKDNEGNDQVVPEKMEEDQKEDKDKKIPELKEENELQKDVIKDNSKHGDSKSNPEENETKIETPGDFVSTYSVSRGTESLISAPGQSTVHKDVSMLPDVPVSLETIQLADSSHHDAPVMTQLSHQLCEQLRLILEPTKASKLQGDFKTGKRLNMRKIIPYIASQFKKDKIWLRRVKPNKREFQVLVALDDSSSMSDNKSREMALSSLNTLSSALALLEVGQMGVLRFGKTAEVVHGLGSQWSQAAGARIQNQFHFEQKETSLISLLNLSTQLFMKSSSSAARNLTVSQLLVIVSDGRGVFHEGKEKVMQAVRRARHAGYFCLFLIVENPEAKDSVLDIRLPVFSAGKLLSIDSYMEHFPFDHYIVLRDVNNLPHTLSDALRQWFELVIG